MDFGTLILILLGSAVLLLGMWMNVPPYAHEMKWENAFWRRWPKYSGPEKYCVVVSLLIHFVVLLVCIRALASADSL
jgi:hypothetical protein